MQDTELFALVDNMFKKEAIYVETRDSSAFHAYAIAANRLLSGLLSGYRVFVTAFPHGKNLSH